VGSNPTRPARTPPAIIPYVQHLQKEGFKPQTIESHSKILRFLGKHVQLNDPEAVRLFVANQHVSSGRKENEVDVFSSFAKYHKIAFSEPRYTREETLPFIAQEVEMEEVINACRSLRHATCLRLLKETAMRIGEASRLQFKDFDFERRTVRVIPEKGSRSRELRLSEKLVAMIQHLFAKKQSFPTPEAARHYLENTRKILAETNNNPRFLQIHLHSFRHFRATMLYAQTRDLLYVMKILGHRSITNTIRYTQLVDFKDGESFICKVAKSISEASCLIESGFDYVTEVDGVKLFRKRK
jgi:integrase/recombinase XerD